MTMICGRPYVLFDPEQTAEIKRIERRNDLIDQIISNLNEVLVPIDEYVHLYTSDKELRETLLDAIVILQHLSGVEYDEDVEKLIHCEVLPRINWKGDREVLC
ncbi:hypothetical protein [Brevibacillus laterosporus]|uniref:Uncharacterized protein n=1 Tax=Brevibacillus laterosporus TaxID=1465 RepID=A0AAP8QGS2_BRELA|nr:hypothetical protein [Brevibacillus laterosporus]PPB12912.1 hypothetical protein C4A77_00570 [Brevibacillus laterosporus]